MMTSSSSIIVTGKAVMPRLFRYSRPASSVATSWCSYRTPLDARNSSSVRQLNQPGWVYTCTFMVFSITHLSMPLRLGPLQVALEESRLGLECLWPVVDVLPWVRMQALIVGAELVEQLQLPLALKTLIVPLHHKQHRGRNLGGECL